MSNRFKSNSSASKTNNRFDSLRDDSTNEQNHFKKDDRPRRNNREYNERNRYSNYNSNRNSRPDNSNFAHFVEKKPPILTDDDFPEIGSSQKNAPVTAVKSEEPSNEVVSENKEPSFLQITKEECKIERVSEGIKPGWVEIRRGPNRELIYTYGPKEKNTYDHEAYKIFDERMKYKEWLYKYEKDKEDFIELYGWDEYYKYHYPTDDEEEEEEEECYDENEGIYDEVDY